MWADRVSIETIDRQPVESVTDVDVDVYGLTDLGNVRSVNEDQFLIADLCGLHVRQTSLSRESYGEVHQTPKKLLLVADGAGGQGGGKRASTITASTATQFLLEAAPRLLSGDGQAVLEDLEHLVEICHSEVRTHAEAYAASRKMATTLTLACILWPRSYIAHAGDSRCYLFRSSKLEQITKDHTIAQLMADSGDLDPKALESSPWSHVLWNAIGGGLSEVSVETHKVTLRRDDVLLLCTDGLIRHVPDERIVRLLEKPTSSEVACRQLVEAAKQAGGRDNITVVVARFGGDLLPAVM